MSPYSANHLADALGSGLVLVDHDARIRLWNRWMTRHARVVTSNVLGQPLSQVLDGHLDPRIQMAIRESLDVGLPSLLSHALHPSPFPLYPSASGTERIKQSVSISPVPGVSAKRWCLIQIGDVTSIVRREQLLRQQTRRLSEKLQKLTSIQDHLHRNELRFRELTRQAPVGIFEIDLDGKIIFANERLQHMLGHRSEDAPVDAWYSVVAIEDREKVVADWQVACRAGQRFVAECRWTNRSSMRKFWVSVDAMPIRNESGDIGGYIATANDVHEAKETSLRNAKQATFDALTGLYNRTPFNERLDGALAANNEPHPFALMFIDLDEFKSINDTHGHEAGDTVLKTVARRLRRLLRADDTVARFGGDEFVAMLSEVKSDPDLALIVAKVERAIAHPINIGTCHVQLHCSVGTAIYPRDGRDAATLLRHSDTMMYSMKRGRRDTSDEPLQIGVESWSPVADRSSLSPDLSDAA